MTRNDIIAHICKLHDSENMKHGMRCHMLQHQKAMAVVQQDPSVIRLMENLEYAIKTAYDAEAYPNIAKVN